MKFNKYDNFAPMLDFEQYVFAFKECRNRTAWKKSIQSFWYNFAPNVFNIIDKLEKKEIKLAKPDEFFINERGKPRLIRSIPIEERIFVKVLCKNIIQPVIVPQLIYHNSACIKGKGTLFAKKQLKKQLHAYYINYGYKGYVLTVDFSKFFQNIDHDILYSKLFKLFKNEDIRWLLKLIIDSFGEKGLALGSELSQLLATWFPNDLDHFIKEKLHIKYYGRYMDDFYLIHHDIKYLKYCLEEIKKVCEGLKITINEKKTKFHTVENGFKFLQCNFFITPKGKVIIKPSKKNNLRLRRKLRKYKKMLDIGKINYEDVRNTYESWKGHLNGSNHFKMLKNMERFYLKLFELDKYQKQCYYRKNKKNKKGLLNMKFSLISSQNIIKNIIEADSIEIAMKHKDYNKDNTIIIPTEWFHKVGLDFNNFKIPTNKERIKKKEIILKDNEVYDEATDAIIMLMPDQKYENGTVISKTLLEQYNEGIITKEQYEERVNIQRQNEYQAQTDSELLGLMRDYLNRNKNKLNEEEKAILEEINIKVDKIKAENPKEKLE